MQQPQEMPELPPMEGRNILFALDPEASFDGYHQQILGRAPFDPAERDAADKNYRNALLRHHYELAQSKNTMLVIPRQINARVDGFLTALDESLEQLPQSIMRKARTPIPLLVTRIMEKTTRGDTALDDSQGAVRLGVSQAFDTAKKSSDPVNKFLRDVNETTVHEIIHKLSTQHDREGRLIMPRQDFMELFRVNDIRMVHILKPEDREAIAQAKSMQLIGTKVDALPQNPEDFLYAIKNLLYLPQNYGENILEIIAFSATNVDMRMESGIAQNPKHNFLASRRILRRNLLREALPCDAAANLYRGFEFDDDGWQEYYIQKFGTEESPEWHDVGPTMI